MRGRILEKLCSERSVMQIDGHSSVIMKRISFFFTVKTPNVHIEFWLMTYTVYFLQIIF